MKSSRPPPRPRDRAVLELSWFTQSWHPTTRRSVRRAEFKNAIPALPVDGLVFGLVANRKRFES